MREKPGALRNAFLLLSPPAADIASRLVAAAPAAAKGILAAAAHLSVVLHLRRLLHQPGHLRLDRSDTVVERVQVGNGNIGPAD